MIANLIMKEFFEHKICPETNVKSQPKQEKIIKENVEKIRKLSNGAYEIVTKFLGGETKEVIKSKKIKGINWEDDSKSVKVVVTQKLIFKSDKSKPFNFNQLLPRRAYFLKGIYNKKYLGLDQNLSEDKSIGFGYFFDIEGSKEKIINIAYNSFTKPGDRLILLHELGHAMNYRRYLDKENEYITTLGNIQNNVQSKNRQKANKREVLVKLSNHESKEVPTPLPKSLYVKYNKLRAEDERMAWAFALKKLRDLRKQGIDLEPELDTYEKIEKIIYDVSLSSYQKEIYKRVLDKEVYHQLLSKIFDKKGKSN